MDRPYVPARFLIAISLATSICPFGPTTARADPVVEGEEHCVIDVATNDTLNVRTGPGVGYQVVAQKRYGQCGVMVTGTCTATWCPIEDGHIAGWVNRRFISMVSPAMYCVSGVQQGDVLNVRAYPSAGSRILTALDRRQCDISFLPYAVGAWQKIRVAGWEGWVARRFLSGQ
jgi:SH3-like domain-containing protein